MSLPADVEALCLVEHGDAERETIERLQALVAAMPQYEPKTEHYFADGMYCRWVFRQKGSLVIGKVHKKRHFYLVVQGEVQIGETRLKAPCVVVSEPGTKRAVYALEDSICVTFHRTEFTDLEEVENDLVEDDPNSMYLPGNRLKALEKL